MPHYDAAHDTGRSCTDRNDLLQRAFTGYSFGMFSGLAGLLVVGACVAEVLR